MPITRPRIVFCATASPELGGGHVKRCLALARAFKRQGASVVFLTSPGTTDIVKGLKAEECIETPKSPAAMVTGLKTALPNQADVLVIDDYGLGIETQLMLRPLVKKLIVIEDLPTRAHDCDLLVDPTEGRVAQEYESLVPSNTSILTGARYALLGPEFAAARTEALARRRSGEPVRRVFVSFGLADTGGGCAVALRALAHRGIAVDVAVGASAPSLNELTALVASMPQAQMHLDTSDVARLMAQADLAIGATGGTSWERCCLGLPTLALPVAENQKGIAAVLAQLGAADILPATALHEKKVFNSALEALLIDTDHRTAMSVRAAAICDGRGAERVAVASLSSQVTLRPANADDARKVWNWREADTRFYKDTNPTPWQDHAEWFSQALKDPHRKLFIATSYGVPVGHLRFDRIGAASKKVSICMAPEVQGRGLGKKSLELGCVTIFAQSEIDVLIAEIHRDNQVSQRLFMACGFEFDSAHEQFDRYTYRAGEAVAGTTGSVSANQ